MPQEPRTQPVPVVAAVPCPRCSGAGLLCRGCSGLAIDRPELFGACDLPEVACPACAGEGTVPPGTRCLDLKTKRATVAEA